MNNRTFWNRTFWVCFWLFVLLLGIYAHTWISGAGSGGLADVRGVVDALGLVFLAVFSYFLPSIVAAERKHRNRSAIFTLNLLAGWTFIGWVVAMVWAVKNEPVSS
jgi:T4 superinfection immunity protein